MQMQSLHSHGSTGCINEPPVNFKHHPLWQGGFCLWQLGSYASCLGCQHCDLRACGTSQQPHQLVTECLHQVNFNKAVRAVSWSAPGQLLASAQGDKVQHALLVVQHQLKLEYADYCSMGYEGGGTSQAATWLRRSTSGNDASPFKLVTDTD